MMTKEAKAKAIVNLITGHAPWNNWNGIARSAIEQSIANGLAEYAKQQAISFFEHLKKYASYGDNTPEQLYNQFIEQQNKEQ